MGHVHKDHFDPKTCSVCYVIYSCEGCSLRFNTNGWYCNKCYIQLCIKDSPLNKFKEKIQNALI